MDSTQAIASNSGVDLQNFEHLTKLYSSGNDNNYPIPGMYSSLFMNKGSEALMNRYQKGFAADIAGTFNQANVNAAYDPEKIDYITERFEEQTSLPRRIFGCQDELPDVLSGDTGSTVNFIKNYGIKNGDPAAAIKKIENLGFIFAEGQNNTNLELVADAVLDTQNARVAALLVLESGDGICGANTPILDKLFVQSKEKMNDIEYNKFIRDTAKEFKELSGGKSMTNFIKDEYSFLGIHAFDLLVRDKGKEYVRIIDNAYDKNQNIRGNYGMFPGMMGLGFLH